MVCSMSRSSISASATGPILPFAVESKVEQYFQKNLCAPAACNHASAARHSATASSTAAVRHFKAITSNAAVSFGIASGTPRRSATGTPDRASIPARSVAPVKSSAIQPSRVVMFPHPEAAGSHYAHRAWQLLHHPAAPDPCPRRPHIAAKPPR